MVYIGKEKGASENDVRASDRTVLSLVDEYLDEGRALVVDNYYTNAAIATKLLHKKTHLIGALRKNSKGIPKKRSEAYPSFENRRCYMSRTRWNCCWKDKGEVRFLTTKHKGEIISTGKKNRQNKMIKNQMQYYITMNANKELMYLT